MKRAELRFVRSLVQDRLDVVAVGVEQEGAVVALVVLGAQAGRAVVAAAGGEAGGVERVDLVARWRPGTRCACRRAAARPGRS